MGPRSPRRFALVASAVLLASVACTEALAAAPPAAQIMRSPRPVLVDGALDDPCWAKASAVRVDYRASGNGRLSEKPRMVTKYAWDEHYLYIGYETFDGNLVALGTGRTQGPEGNRREGCEISWHGERVDVVEFFISFGDERFFWELHHNAANQFNDIWVTVPDPTWPISRSSLLTHGILFGWEEYVPDDGQYTVATAVRPKPKAREDGTGELSTVNDPADIDTGYTAEIRLPWRGIGAPEDRAPVGVREPADGGLDSWRMSGRILLILAVVQDGDLEERYHHSSPTGRLCWFHKAAHDWPRYVLTESVRPPAGAPSRGRTLE